MFTLEEENAKKFKKIVLLEEDEVSELDKLFITNVVILYSI